MILVILMKGVGEVRVENRNSVVIKCEVEWNLVGRFKFVYFLNVMDKVFVLFLEKIIEWFKGEMFIFLVFDWKEILCVKFYN